jgi:membrane associated rhomboid family serine protease
MISFLSKRKKARVFVLLIVLPSLFTYVHLRNWLLTNRCTAILRFPKDEEHGQYTSSHLNILECQSKQAEFPSQPFPSIVILTQSIMQNIGTPQPTSTVVDKTFLFPSVALLSSEANSSQLVTSNTVNKYGFRTNHKKIGYDKHESPIALTTILLAAINIGLYWTYWNFRVDPSPIVLNAEITQDYGRAFSSAFGHFEIWHVGFNMMTLFTLGNVLEEQLYGSIPFLMYTLAFVPLTALVVVALQRVFTTAPSSMVGFSGILFAWSVVATLSTSQTCPIMFLPDLCFNTYRLLDGKVTVSLGPLVQLVFLQVVLPRVSFVGHLSGIIVGFCWHWSILPPLEWLQPCILYPVFWIVGKLLVPRLSGTSSNSRVTSGGGLLVSTTGDTATALRRLGWALAAMMVHGFLLLYCIGGARNSILISECLLIIILSIMVNNHKSATAGSAEHNLGMVGRGYVILVALVWMTDSMTVTGWILFRQPISAIAAAMIVFRWILWYASLCLVCYIIEATNQTLPGSIWRHVCGWLILDACQPVGAWGVDHSIGMLLPCPFVSKSSSRYFKLSQTTSLEESEQVSHVV